MEHITMNGVTHTIYILEIWKSERRHQQISAGENFSIQLTDQFISQSYYERGCIQISLRTLLFPKACKD